MNLTRKQELALIDMGLKQLLDNLVKKPEKVVEKKVKGRKWTKEQRAKFAKSMSKVWKNKKQAKLKDES